MVHFMCHLDGLRDGQIASKTSFLGMTVRLSLEETHIWISRQRKDHPHQCRWEASNSLRTWIEQKSKERGNSLCLSLEIYLLLPLNIVAPGSQAFRLRPGVTLSDTRFSGLWTQTELYHQPTDGRSWDILASMTVSANSFYWFCFSDKLWLI